MCASTAIIQRRNIALSACNYATGNRSTEHLQRFVFLSRYPQGYLLVQHLLIDLWDLIRDTRKYFSPILSVLRLSWVPCVTRQFPEFYKPGDGLPSTTDGFLVPNNFIVIPRDSRSRHTIRPCKLLLSARGAKTSPKRSVRDWFSKWNCHADF